MLTLTEDQVRWFRARRQHLLGPGAPTAADAARAVLGIQAQQIEPALFSLAQRTAGRPTASALAGDLHGEATPTLVRTWGQRDTVHIYDAEAHWQQVLAARTRWHKTSRPGPFATPAQLEPAVAALRALGRAACRRDLYDAVPADYLDATAEAARTARQDPIHFAAGRLLYGLSHAGAVSTVHKVGSEQFYALRQAHFPGLAWAPESPDPMAAAVDCTEAYLAVSAPASAKDVAHHFGSNVTPAKGWLAALRKAGKLVDVACGDRKGLVALAADADALTAQPSGDWPARLLPNFDTMLMAHADKGWAVPNPSDRKAIWRPAARVLATVLAEGRLVATWKHKARKNDVTVTITPLSGWDRAWLADVEAEAQVFAEHLGRQHAAVVLA